MHGSPAPRHLAIVPLVGLDPLAERALAYAGQLAAQVVAVHVRDPDDTRGRAFEATWAQCAPTVPLMILDGSAGGWQRPFLKALAALRRSAQPDLISVVVPPQTTGALRLALLRQPDVIVRSLPMGESPAD